jgi:hypothetical protein
VGKAANFPATLADLQSLDTTMPLVANGRRPETIGQTLARLIERIPDPLPTATAQQMAATFAADPAAWGRLFIHCIHTAQTEEGGHE